MFVVEFCGRVKDLTLFGRRMERPVRFLEGGSRSDMLDENFFVGHRRLVTTPKGLSPKNMKGIAQ